jgi:hypothetical protein
MRKLQINHTLLIELLLKKRLVRIVSSSEIDFATTIWYLEWDVVFKLKLIYSFQTWSTLFPGFFPIIVTDFYTVFETIP